MIERNSTTTVSTPHYGIWSHSLKTQRCEACGRDIPAHEHYLRFPYFEGREHSIACILCALGPEPQQHGAFSDPVSSWPDLAVMTREQFLDWLFAPGPEPALVDLDARCGGIMVA